ncbi:MAG: Asp-tRNA(Asn)/Glu-tRNA(Gln) amidotransferase subunit GatA [Parachlamydiales bacterium]|nr:Asp-tRNA(Asn)/Glu-tRNA(Gln) amidotransferase subunit GatA [Parachlamydiales bacterium]
MTPLHHLSAIEIRDLFCRGEVSAVQIAEYFLRRIEQYNTSLGAYLSVLGPRVMMKAESLDKKRAKKEPVGRLAGVPIAIKDNMHILHEITTCGSNFLSNYKAPFAATAVHLLEDEDALILGKTNMDEFAMGSSNENSAFGPVQNPWNAGCVPGGSSGGSAAAVAARLGLIATGTDTGGSIRQPASFCGVVGYKPTYGRVSRYGLVAFGSSLDQIGPFTTTVADAALAMEVMGQHCPHDATSLDLPPESYPLSKDLEPGTVIGVPWRFLEGLTSEARKNFDDAIQVMKDKGAQIVDVDLDILKYSIAVYYILATAEASTNLARFDGIRFGIRSKNAKSLEEVYELTRKEGFGREVKKRIMLGTYVLSSGFQDAFYKKAQKVRTLIIDAFEAAFNTCDAVMMPVTTSAAFEHGAIQDPIQMYLQDIFTVPANLAGLPGISVPSGYDSRGMPLGLQILGPQMCDVALMQIAYAYEQATNHLRIPRDYE